MAGHADTQRLNYMVGGTIVRAGMVGLLTDAGVVAADTLNGLDAFVNGVSVHADNFNYKPRVKQAWRITADYTDAAVLNLTTVAGLAALSGAPAAALALLPDD